jgi:hypothetical protein
LYAPGDKFCRRAPPSIVHPEAQVFIRSARSFESFADVPRAAQRASRGVDVWALPVLLDRLEKGSDIKTSPGE